MRNGPPEAVSTIFSTAPRLPSASDWKIALCSESTGSSVAPACLHGAQHHVAGAHQGFLVGQANISAAADRREGGRQPGGAGDRRHGPIRLQRSRRNDGLGSGGDLDAGASEGVTQRRIGGGVGDHGDLGAQRDRLLGQQCRVSASDQGSHPVTVRLAASSSIVCVPTLPVLPRTVTERTVSPARAEG